MSVPVPYRTASAMVRDGKLILSQARFERAPKVTQDDLQNSSDHAWRAKGHGPRAKGHGKIAGLSDSLRHPAGLRTDWNAHCAFGAVKFAPRQTLAVVKRLAPDGPTVAFARPSPTGPPR